MAEEKKVKTCPFLACECIGDECALHMRVTQHTPAGIVHQFTCALVALVLVESGKVPQPSPARKLHLPIQV